MMANLTQLTVVMAVTLFSASAHAASHDDTVASGQAAIINALVAGASTYAPAELQLARETLERSRRAIAQQAYTQAMHLASMAAEAARAAEAKALEQRGLVMTANR